MSKQSLNQRGFAAMEAVLVVIILAIIGGTGYYVYHANSKATDTQNAAQTDANSAVSHKNNNTVAQQYVTIKEWKVRVPYSGKLNLQYALVNGKGQANFTSAELLKADPACTAGFGGQINRYAPNDPTGDGTSDAPTAKELAAKSDKSAYAYVGGFYYFFMHSQSGCGTDTSKTQSIQQQTNNAVKALVPKLQPVGQAVF